MKTTVNVAIFRDVNFIILSVAAIVHKHRISFNIQFLSKNHHAKTMLKPNKRLITSIILRFIFLILHPNSNNLNLDKYKSSLQQNPIPIIPRIKLIISTIILNISNEKILMIPQKQTKQINGVSVHKFILIPYPEIDIALLFKAKNAKQTIIKQIAIIFPKVKEP